ncbi:MAG: hypothetical protein H6608_06980 [Flavobacteriales bacterium]|nr:hypothetical protein [Bacteroidota bacterium]MCB9240855.1 hypothetical protein [Flavobacteriales bacterium]
MRLMWLVILFTLNVSFARSQPAFVDTIRTSLNEKPRFVLGLNNRYALVSGVPLRTNGIQAGMDFNDKVRILFGANWMPNAYVERDISNGIPPDTITIQKRLSFFSLTGSYSLRMSEKWRFDFPILIGMGVDDRTTTHSTRIKPTTESRFIVPFEFGASAVYSINSWFGVKAGLGNRLTFGRSFSTNSGPYYALGLTVFAKPFVDWAKKIWQ